MNKIRSIPISSGADWYRLGWKLFKAQPTMLVLLFLATGVINALLGLIPLLGGLIMGFISPALSGGYFLALRRTATGQSPTFADLFDAFTNVERRNPMMTLGLVSLGAQIAMTLIGQIMLGGSIGSMALLAGGPAALLGAGGLGVAFLALIADLVIAAALWLALFFAVPLVMLDAVAPVDALQLSVQANLRNIMPWLVFSLILIPLTVLALIPFGLGLLLLCPVVGAAMLRAYEETFELQGTKAGANTQAQR